MKKTVQMNCGMAEVLPEEIARKLECGKYILEQDIGAFELGESWNYRYVTVEALWEEKDIPEQIELTRDQIISLVGDKTMRVDRAVFDYLLNKCAIPRKITAIKLFREVMEKNCRAKPGLVDAKKYVETLEDYYG